jgi:hypothetical protein
MLSVHDVIEQQGESVYRSTLRRSRWMPMTYSALVVAGTIALSVFNAPWGAILAFLALAVPAAFAYWQQHYTYAMYCGLKVMYAHAVPYLYAENEDDNDDPDAEDGREV